MRTLLLVFCALLLMSASVEAKKKMKLPASQQTTAAKQHRAMLKQTAKAHKAPKHAKHSQRVN
jgi:hypothetical protein